MSHNDVQTSPLHITALSIQDELKKLPELSRRISRHNQRVFSIDLALVAHCLRTGYLVDSVAPKNPVETFSSLISMLRSNPTTKDLFATVVHVFEPSSEQSFFVNAKLLSKAPQPLLPIQTKSPNVPGFPPLFLRLGPQFEVLDKPPNDLCRIIDCLLPLTSTSESLPLSFALPTDISLTAAVPLAAILLDYPIAYIPSLDSSPSNNGLSGVPLNLYECILTLGAKDHVGGMESGSVDNAHTIMKFSCPAQMAEMIADRCRPQKLISQLQEMFTARLQLIGDPDLAVDVIHSAQTLDQITF